jgi:hypothetical protein
MPGDGLAHGPPAKTKAGGSYHRFSQIIRHSLRDGFNGFLRTLPGVHDLLVTVVREITTRGLSASQGAPGPYDFFVRNEVIRPRKACALTPSRPSHPVSRVVTIAIRPSGRGGMHELKHISEKQKTKIFSRQDWTVESALNGQANSGFS